VVLSTCRLQNLVVLRLELELEQMLEQRGKRQCEGGGSRGGHALRGGGLWKPEDLGA
jgi:hypothetical protein